MRVFIRDAAYADLENIYRYIAKDSRQAARSVIERIFVSIERLSVFPRLGRDGILDGTLEWVVPRLPYIIVYVIDEVEQELSIIAVFHGAQERG